VVIDHGRVIAKGTSDQLKDAVGGDRVEITVRDPARIAAARTALAPMATGEITVIEDDRRVLIPVSGGSTVLVSVIRDLDAAGVEVDDLVLRRPTLDDVFLTLTGHVAEEAAPAPAQPAAGRGRKGA
jgi:ABC-2 type transport system ATP-binding protein